MPEHPQGDRFSVDLFPVSCLATDKARRIRFANAQAAVQLGRPRDELLGSSLEVILTPAAQIFCDSFVFPLLLTEGRCDEVALTVTRGCGERAPVIVNACTDADDPDIVYWSIMSAEKREKLQDDLLSSRNLLQRQAQSLQKLASRDDLTGLVNRRESTRLIEQLISAADRADATIAVLLLDIDHFKAINDTHGHQIGDNVLRQLGACFADMVRLHEIAGRYGGEEFIFALAAEGVEAVRPFNARLHAAASSVTGCAFPVTVSIGLYFRPPRSNQTFDDIFKPADRALYRAKALGRNRSMMERDGAVVPFA